MAILALRTLGDADLRRHCCAVGRVDARARAQLADLLDTLHAAPHGAALAAPQAGILRRMVVIDMGEGPLTLVNPRIVWQQGEQRCLEGCLSIPGKAGRTLRPARVTVEALDADGTPISLSGTGAMAKCLCHELDHLDGVLFIDRALEVWELGAPAAAPPAPAGGQ